MDYKLGILSDGPNACGMWLAGVVPHRGAFAQKLAKTGDAKVCNFSKAAKGYWLHQVEPFDAHENAHEHLSQAEFVVSCQSLANSELEAYADVILPLALPAETSGIWVNTEGRWQFVQAAVLPSEQIKPGWKIYQALAKCLDHSHISFNNLEQIRQEITSQNEELEVTDTSTFKVNKLPKQQDKLEILNYYPTNQQDIMVRNAPSLQALAKHKVMIHPETYQNSKFQSYDCNVSQTVAPGVVIIPKYQVKAESQSC